MIARLSSRRVLLALAALLVAGFIGSWQSAGLAQDKSPESLQGAQAPDVTFKQLVNGQESSDVKLSSMKGNVVVLDYWATWCPPCRKSLPHLNEMSKDQALAAKGLKIYAIDSREKTDKVAAFIAENKYTFNVLLDPNGEFGEKYFVSGIPTTVVIGRDGKVAKAFVGFSEEQSPKALMDAVDEALKADKPS